MEELVVSLSAVAATGALVTAVAAWRSAKATERATEVTERAALLGAIPLLVPWVDVKEGSLKVKNRGSADAHELKWRIEADGKRIDEGEVSGVIGAARWKRLIDQQSAIVSAMRVKAEAVIVCEYLTSWGEALTLERTYREGKSHGIRLLDSEERRLTLAASESPRSQLRLG